MKPYYFVNGHNRLGDEIQMTAVLQYYKERWPDREIFYRHINSMFNSEKYFPEGLVTFTTKEPEGEFEFLKEHNLWIWAPFLRSRGIYTKLKVEYDPNGCDYDVVFCPLWEPAYNPQRAMNPMWCAELANLLQESGYKVAVVFDRAKDKYVGPYNPEVELVSSDSLDLTFDYIHRSRVFIGGDSGATHFAGALGHPRIIAVYGDLLTGKNDFNWQRLEMGKLMKEPHMSANHNFNFDSRPDCDPSHFSTYWLFNNAYPKEGIKRQVDRFMGVI